jgi:hypothetical protein
MRLLAVRVCAFAAIAVVVAGCNRNPTQTESQPAPAPATTAAPVIPPPAAPPPIPAATELPLNTVDSVMLSRPSDAPTGIVIEVSGTALSPGWTNAKLVEDPDSGADVSVKTYKFVATSPEMPDENRTAAPIEAQIRIDSLSAEVKTIRVVSATNEVAAPIAQ